MDCLTERMKKRGTEGPRLGNRRGSASIFLMIFFTIMVGMVMTFVYQAREKAVGAAADCLCPLWASSVLGKYDRDLYDRFGLFAFQGDEADVEQMVLDLADYSFGEKRYADVDGCSAGLSAYSLGDPDNLEPQLRSCVLAELLTPGTEEIALPPTGSRGELLIDQVSDREILNGGIIKGLPSYGRTNDSLLDRAASFFRNLSSAGELIKEGTDAWIAGRYIDRRFHHLLDARREDDSFFLCEQEYLICGKMSDTENLKGTRRRILAVREALNLAYLNTDEEKRDAALAAAELLTPGPAAALTMEGILAAWALAESYNDYKLLIHGKPVPMIKDASCWAIDLDAVTENREEGYIDTGCRRGDSYEDYLAALIYLLGENNKYLRMMDLIQIDMRYCYNGDFLVKECWTGLDLSVTVNGKAHEARDSYE